MQKSGNTENRKLRKTEAQENENTKMQKSGSKEKRKLRKAEAQKRRSTEKWKCKKSEAWKLREHKKAGVLKSGSAKRKAL